MALSKIQAESMNLADTFAFTGTVSGSSMDLLLSHENNSSSPDPSPAYYDISSTYINSTYDNYLLVGYFEGDADTRYLQCQVFVGGTVQTASGYYGYGSAGVDGENYANTNSDTDLFTATSDSMGGEDGEGVSINAVFQNANNTQAPFCASGIATKHNNNGHHGAFTFSGSLVPTNRASVVNGIRLKMHSGDLTNFKFRFYGLKD